MASAKQPYRSRPPIITLMGHIDHGKTSLLDKILSTNLWHQESGGITQHISAYTLKLKTPHGSQLATFIDTPGHAAFKAMRQQGSLVTDLVILVVSATQGVQAQTKECLKLIQENNLPFIVAINKIDLKNSSIDQVKGQLAQAGFTPEDYGGQIACIPVSAKSGEGIDKLLDNLFLLVQILELKNLPQASLQAHIIESKLEKGRGPVAVVVVKQGTLKVGDQIYSSTSEGKVKALLDYRQKPMPSLLPGFSATLLGFARQPQIGSLITHQPPSSSPPQPSSPQPASSPAPDHKLPIIVKGDTQGTLQALLGSFSNDVAVINSGVGPVTNNDIFLAQASQAQIFAFNLKTPQFIKNLAKNQKVRLFESNVIYEIIDDVNSQVLKLLEPTINETVTGQGQIIAQFDINHTRVAGVSCSQGKLKLGDQIHLQRDGQIIKNTTIGSLRQGKQEVSQVKSGQQCGIIFKPYVDFHPNDVIISYYKTEES